MNVDDALQFAYRAANEFAEKNLRSFVRMAWPILNPGRPLIWGKHMDAICEHLEAVTSGQIRRLIVNVPPGHSKTSIISVCWPCWEWIRKPNRRYIFATYSDGLSKKSSVDRQSILSSDWYSHAFNPTWEFGDKVTQTEVRTDQNGFMLATSVGGKGTGFHADVVVVDDPIKAADIYTIELQRHVRWMHETLMSRRTDIMKTAFVIVQQRLHEADLSGDLLQNPAWVHLKLPAEYNPITTVSTPIWKDWRTIPGEPLFPERFPVSALEEEKGPFGLGATGYAAQWNQDPVAGSGNILRKEWWRYWFTAARAPTGERLHQKPAKFDSLIGSWDMTYEKGIATDFVVGQVWGRHGANFYLLDQVRSRLSFVETLAAFRDLASRWPTVTRWLVEKKANGAAIIDMLRNEVAGLIPVNPTESKEARVAAISPLVEAGNVYLPNVGEHPWVAQVIDECSAFPNGMYDDVVDALSQALRDLMSYRYTLVEFQKKPDRPSGRTQIDLFGEGSRFQAERAAWRKARSAQRAARKRTPISTGMRTAIEPPSAEP